METRGEQVDKRTKSRPPVARRSCDQCRARKVACDRKSPCSNCETARVSCTHSPVAPHTVPKQRILISAQYEQRIEDIANNVASIKRLLEDGGRPSAGATVSAKAFPSPPHHSQESLNPVVEYKSIAASNGVPLWDYSSHLIDFVKSVVQERTSRDVTPEDVDVLSSLTKLLHALENPGTSQNLPMQASPTPPMPPILAVVKALRWAQGHATLTRIVWISQFLPLHTFVHICRKIYFAINDYNDVDLVLANSFLACVFSEQFLLSGQQEFKDYDHACRINLEVALARLPLLLPASTEVIAALMLGAFNAVENSKATVAWTYVSTATNLCQTLGYHRRHHGRNIDEAQMEAQGRLFWAIYGIEKGLSLRLGRASNIRDSEITLPISSQESRSTRLGRINGMIYDQLYSPASLNLPIEDRTRAVEGLAHSVRLLLRDTQAELSDIAKQQNDDEPDLMRAILPKCDLVCETSLLALILRARPVMAGTIGDVSDDCVVAAREALETHEQCMEHLRGIGNDMIAIYVNWAILYCPFVPFSILFSRAVQLWDMDDLARLDRFADSLQPAAPTDAITHPYRLYKLLCQATRLYLNMNEFSWPSDFSHIMNPPAPQVSYRTTAPGTDGMMDSSIPPSQGLYDWWQDSQQIMALLAGDAIL